MPAGDCLLPVIELRLARPLPPALESSVDLELGAPALGCAEARILTATDAGERGELGIVAPACPLVARRREQRPALGLTIEQLGLALALAGVMDDARLAGVLLAAADHRLGGGELVLPGFDPGVDLGLAEPQPHDSTAVTAALGLASLLAQKIPTVAQSGQLGLASRGGCDE